MGQRISYMVVAGGLALLLIAGLARDDGTLLYRDQPLLQLGDVWETEELEARFSVTNRAKSEVTIGALRADCPCTRVTCDTKTLAPGEEAAVRVLIPVESARTPRQRTAEPFHFWIERRRGEQQHVEVKVIGRRLNHTLKHRKRKLWQVS